MHILVPVQLESTNERVYEPANSHRGAAYSQYIEDENRGSPEKKEEGGMIVEET